MQQENQSSIGTSQPEVSIKDSKLAKFIVLALSVLFIGTGIWFGSRYMSAEDVIVVMEWGAVKENRVTKDNDYVYLGGFRVTDPILDAQTFEHVEGSSLMGYDFYRDKNGVYNLVEEHGNNSRGKNSRSFYVKSLGGADPSTFKVLNDGFIATDKDHVYVRGELVPGSTSNNFRILGMIQTYEMGSYPGYFLAGNKLYSVNDPDNPRDIDMTSFEIVDESNFIFKDKSGAYYGHLKIEKVDMESLKVEQSRGDLNGGFTYIISDVAVYVPSIKELKEVLNADPKSFEVMGFGYAKDKHHVYLGAEIIDTESPSNFTKDKAYELGR